MLLPNLIAFINVSWLYKLYYSYSILYRFFFFFLSLADPESVLHHSSLLSIFSSFNIPLPFIHSIQNKPLNFCFPFKVYIFVYSLLTLLFIVIFLLILSFVPLRIYSSMKFCPNYFELSLYSPH